ncbi:MAG: ATP-binding protein [Anaerolineales bacterium]|nr:ATP-binding protein [Anaerolineales bacterium]
MNVDQAQQATAHPNMSASELAPGDLSLLHLQSELARIDILLQRAVRRWQLAGQDPADSFRGLYISDASADALLARPLGASWGATASINQAEQQAYEQALARISRQSESLIQTARAQSQCLRLERLREAFGLEDFDLDVLLICLAPALDVRYERLYGYLQDDVTRKRPSVNLALDLLCQPGMGRFARWAHFSAQAPLFRQRLVELGAPGAHLLSQELAPDPALISWLLGHYQPHAELGAQARLLNTAEDSAVPPMQPKAWEYLASTVSQGAESPILVFYGPDRQGQQAAARQVSALLGQPLLAVEAGALVSEGASAAAIVRLALRDARMNGATPVLLGWEACLADDSAPPPAVLSDLCEYPGLVILAGARAWQARGLPRQRRLAWVEFPTPAYAQRRALWQQFLGGNARGQPTQATIDLLAGQFLFTSGQIQDACAAAIDAATQRGEALDNQHLFAAARAHSNPNLANLARKIDPRYTWSDIVLPDDQVSILKEIVNTVRGRSRVLDEWGVGLKLASSRGVTLLFSGPPGTGKTMAAEVITAELGLDLYKIDLSTVVSKYIGETEKNLERIFAEAETSNAILFFDEADALFGKRSEVRDSHDRYANIEISYLLQRMEAYDGVTILATNLGANLDEAFKRRLQFAIDFPFPEQAYRLRIWQTLFPPEMPRAADIDWNLLAGRFRIAGGNIRNIIVNAAYLAASDGGQVGMAHLLHGARRELQKMGRLVGDEDFTL